MDFDLSDEERGLQEGIRELLAGRFGMDRVRGGFDRSMWTELGEAGVFGTGVSPSSGGLGLGTTHATVVFEELGRALVPGPLVAQLLSAPLVAGAVDGSRVVAGADPGRRPLLVEHLGAVDEVVVLEPGGLRLVAASAVSGTRVARPLDPLTPVWQVDALPPGEPLGPDDPPPGVLARGTVLTAALQLGNALRTTELAVGYAKEREQFGKPIGAFQAVKHLCADMLVRAEVARAAVYAAAVHLDDPEVGDPARAVATAKLLADEAALHNAKACIQVHGGMGFTWEVDAHLYLKRAVVHRTSFGAPATHAQAVAATL